MLELGKEKHNVWTMVCTVPLLLCAVLAGQRAALVGFGASVGLLFIVFLGPVAWRRLRVHLSQILMAVGAVVAIFILVILVPAALSQTAPKLPFASTFNTELNSTGKAESAQDRINELAAAKELIPEHTILGSGLGVEYSYWAPGPNLEVTSALTEDIYTDLWLRTGLIGLGLFILAVLVSLSDGLRVWRRHPDRMMAVFALSLVAVILGILVKGGFESIFEKYRIATMLGLLLGMLRSTVTSAGSALPSLPVLVGRNTKRGSEVWTSDK
jgi:O-antigen ligase